MKTLGSFATTVVLLLVLGAAPGPVARADLIFTTSGSFSAGTGATAVTNGIQFGSGANTLTITFTGGGDDLTLLPGMSSLGTFDVTSIGYCPVIIPTTSVATTFTLTVDQTTPTGLAPGVFQAATVTAVTGEIAVNNGTVNIYFPEAAVSIDNIVNGTTYTTSYSIENLNTDSSGQYLSLDTPSTSGVMQPTSIGAMIDGTQGVGDPVAAPEPATLTLGVSGTVMVIAYLLCSRRRREPVAGDGDSGR